MIQAAVLGACHRRQARGGGGRGAELDFADLTALLPRRTFLWTSSSGDRGDANRSAVVGPWSPHLLVFKRGGEPPHIHVRAGDLEAKFWPHNSLSPRTRDFPLTRSAPLSGTSGRHDLPESNGASIGN